MEKSKSFRAEIKPGTRALRILNIIDAWCAKAHAAEVQDLWNILTALRGPDSGNIDLKWRSTARIRAQVLPQGASRTGYGINPDGLTPQADDSEHFGIHIQFAVEALERQREPRK